MCNKQVLISTKWMNYSMYIVSLIQQTHITKASIVSREAITHLHIA
jgi:hypothetical protein